MPSSSNSWSQSAFERQTGYDRLKQEFFPEGPCHPKVGCQPRALSHKTLIYCPIQVSLLPKETLDSAWELFENLEKRAEKATSMAAKSVNRNRVGHKKREFKPMQYATKNATRCPC